MIVHKASAVLRLRDSFLDRAVEGRGAICQADGAPGRPLVKPGGYLVWVNLPAGTHTLSVLLPGYCQEELTVEIQPDTIWEGCLNLRPGRAYPYAGSAITASLTVTRASEILPDTAVWLARADDPVVKIAQAKAEKDAAKLRLFCKGPVSAVPVPGAFLLEDSRKPELVRLQSLQQEEGVLAEPLRFPHTRGKALLPAQQYHTDGNGMFSVMLRKGGRLALFLDGKVQYIQPDAESAATVAF